MHFFQSTHERAIIRSIHDDLIPSITCALKDGLKDRRSLWKHIIVEASSLGPATRAIHELVGDLHATPITDSEKVSEFIAGLLRQRSLDCWLSYLSLKDTLLEGAYDDAALMRRATTAYRSQFERMIIALQPLSLVPIHKISLALHATPFKPARLPSDSRVPKSSSIPERLTEKSHATMPAKGEVLTVVVPKETSTTPKLLTPTGLKTSTTSTSKIPVLKSSTSSNSLRRSTEKVPQRSTPARVASTKATLKAPTTGASRYASLKQIVK